MDANLNHILDHDGRDISDLKIYLDAKTDQYKVRHHCEKCSRDLGCYCYDFIDDAITSCNEPTWMCAQHILSEIWVDYELAEYINDVCNVDLEAMDVDSSNMVIESMTDAQVLQIFDDAEIDFEYDGVQGETCRT